MSAIGLKQGASRGATQGSKRKRSISTNVSVDAAPQLPTLPPAKVRSRLCRRSFLAAFQRLASLREACALGDGASAAQGVGGVAAAVNDKTYEQCKAQGTEARCRRDAFFAQPQLQSWLFAPKELRAFRVCDDEPAVAAAALGAQPTRLPLIVGFGNATVDATLVVGASELRAFGVTPGADAAGESQERKAAIVAAVTADPRVDLTPGGAALNSMRVAAWAGRDRVRTAFVGSVGADDHAALLRRAMSAVGVRPLLLEVPSAPSGLPTALCAAIVDAETKDRFLAVVRGAAVAITTRFLDKTAAVKAALGEACVLYVTSFVLSTPQRAACAMRIAEIAEASSAIFALNLSSAGILPKVAEHVIALLPRCRFVFGNADELRALAKLRESGVQTEGAEQSLAVQTQQLARGLAPGGIAVVTNGAGATLVAQQQGETTSEVAVPVVPLEDVVDTNGCGDAFVGGFLCKAAQGASLWHCIEEGHRCAGFILRRKGCSINE